MKKDIKRLKAAAERTSAWSNSVEATKRGTENSGLKPDTGYIGHKAAKMAQRSKSMENRRQAAVEEKSKLLKNLEETESLKLSPLPFYSARFAELENISVFLRTESRMRTCELYHRAGGPDSARREKRQREIKSLEAPMRSGAPFPGDPSQEQPASHLLCPQGTAELCGSLTEYARRYSIDESLLKAILRKMDFSRIQFNKDMELYSGGQKKKVLIARSLCEKAHLYIWDEPLNYIDVFSRMQIEELLLTFKPTLLFVEHDRAFCENIATKTVRYDPTGNTACRVAVKRLLQKNGYRVGYEDIIVMPSNIPQTFLQPQSSSGFCRASSISCSRSCWPDSGSYSAS